MVFSVYGVSGLIGAGREIESTFIILCFSACVVCFLMFVRLLSFEWAHRIQLILWSLVLIPLILLPFIGLLTPVTSSAQIKASHSTTATGLDSLGP